MKQDPKDNQGVERHDPELERALDALGTEARHRPGLVDRIYASSVEELLAPSPLAFEPAPGARGSNWTRVALAACLLLAFAISARLLLEGGTTSTNNEAGTTLAVDSASDAGEYGEVFASDRDTVLVALLDAGSSGRIDTLEYLDGTDSVGVAFAPILGTTGFVMDDFAMEIQSIEVEVRR